MSQHASMKFFLAFLVFAVLATSLGRQSALAAQAFTQTPRPSRTPTRTRTPTPTATPTITQTPVPTQTNTLVPQIGADPQAWLDGTIDLEHFPPKGSLVIHFNTPMDSGSSLNPVLAWPNLEGKVSWDTTQTTLTFKPSVILKSATTYTFFLDPTLRSADGKTLQHVPEWVLHPQSSVKVQRVTPSESTLVRPSFVIDVTFDREMQAEIPDPRLFEIQPAIPAQLSWKADRRTLQIKLAEPLKTNQRYDLTLRGLDDENGLFAADGTFLADDYRWVYWLSPLQVTANVTGPKSLQVGFNYAFDQSQSGLPLSISPALTGEWKWMSNSKLSFTASEPIPAAREYELTLTGGALINPDGIQFESLPETKFIGLAPIRLANLDIKKSSYSPDLYADELLSTIRIEFDLPVEHGSAEQAFSLKPSVPGEFSWDKNAAGSKEILVYHLAERLQPRTAYTVEMGVGLKSVSGQPILFGPWQQQFVSSHYGRPVFGEEGANIQVLDASGPRQLEVSAEEGSVIFAAYPFELFEFAKLYGEHGQDSRYEGMRGISIPKSLEPASVWSAISTKTYKVSSGNSSVNVTTIPGDLPAGLYVITARDENFLLDQLFLVITRNTLVLKRNSNELFAWVSDINGKPSIQAEIRVYTENGEKIRDGETDESGQYRVNLPADLKPVLVAARVRQPGQPDDITIAGLDGDWDKQYPYSYKDPSRYYPKGEPYLIYVYPERPLYKPGQTVYFKAVIRKDRDARYSMPDAGSQVIGRVIDPRGNTVESFEFQINRFGTVNGSFQLSEGSMLGTYTIECDVDGTLYTETFKVADYRKPDYKVTLTSLQPEKSNRFVRGEEMKVQVHVGYYFGEPKGKAVLKVKFYEGDWEFDNGVPKIPTISTDENGNATLTFKAPYNLYSDRQWWGAPTYQDLRLEVTVSDGSGQSVTGAYSFRIYPSAQQLSIDTGGYYHQPGEAFSIKVKAFDLSDHPLPGQKLTLTTSKWNHKKFEYDNIDQTFALETDSLGQATQEIQLSPGYYELSLSGKDEQGNENKTQRWIYIFKNKSDWIFSSQETYLEVSTNKEFYKPYETARLAIESAFSGPALLSFERGSVINTRIIELTAPLTIIDTEIIPEHAPNVYITVNAWQPAGDQVYRDYYFGDWWYQTQADSFLRVAKTHVLVDASSKALDIQILPEKQVYAPGETLNATIEVKDSAGKPILAELSLAVVDEALFALANEKEPIFEAFYGPRGHSVITFDSMAPTRWLQMGGAGGGGGGLPPSTRADFPDTSAWLPVIETDTNGQAQVSVKLPDNTTSWRLSVKAITLDHQVGQAQVNVETKKEIFLRPILPRILTNGDLVTLTTFVHNYTDQSQILTVMLNAPGIELLSPAETQILASPGEAVPVSWPTQVKSAKPTEVTFTVKDTEGILDAIQLPLALQPAAIHDIKTQSGEFTNTLTLVLPLPNLERETSLVHLSLNRSLGGTLLGGLDYLIGYPYGCVEQTMSRALPNAVVSRAVGKLGLDGSNLQQRLPPMIEASIDHLYSLQHIDGGWGWWADDITDPYQTAWVLYGLGLVQESGYPVEPKVIDRGVDWLEAVLKDNDLDLRTRAYILYSLASVGYGNLEQTRALITDSIHTLDPFSQASLALALNHLGEKDQARQVLALLAQEATINGEQVYWSQPRGDGEYHSKTMSSSMRTTALVLLAFAEIDPQNELVPGIVKYIAAQRRGIEGWGTTNETSYAILALTEYLVSQEALAGSTPYEVLVNGQSILSGVLEVGHPNASIDLPLEKLNLGINSLMVKSEGDHPLYYDLSTRYDLIRNEVEAAGTISISRRYLDPKTKTPIDLSSIQVGQLVRVELTINIPETAYYLAIEDYLPGGLEALDEGLSATIQASTEFWGYYEDFTAYRWSEYGYNYKEIRGDRVVFFITNMAKNARTFTYYARATTPGDFLALPTQVYAMYDPTLWGRSNSTNIKVSK